MPRERGLPPPVPLWWYGINITLTTDLLIMSALVVSAPLFSWRMRAVGVVCFIAAGSWRLFVLHRLRLERGGVLFVVTLKVYSWMGLIIAAPVCVVYGMAAFVYVMEAMR